MAKAPGNEKESHMGELTKSENYIDGKWVGSPRRFDVTNPADGSIVARVADAGAAETKMAISAAERAFPSWSALTAKARAGFLRRWFDLIMSHQEELAQLMTAEQGKPLSESRGEVAYGGSFIEWFAEEGKRAYGQTIPTTAATKRFITLKQPIGVCAAITPWNFPIAMITRKAGPALAAGCTIVIKPAAETPLCALALAALAEKAGIPDGVLNVVCGTAASEIGLEMCQSPIVKKLSFTGSTDIGKILYRQCAGTVKKLSLELGGNAPFIVFDDADIDAAVAGAIISKFRNAGQTCVCSNRLFVQAGIYDAFAEKFTAAVEAMKVGAGVEDGVLIGPLINRKAIDKVSRMVHDSVSEGARILTGGEHHDRGDLFYTPTVLADVAMTMPVASDEIFGPVAPLIRFETEEEAIRMANATPYGLAAYFYARDISRVWRVAEQLDYGMVAINEPILSTEVVPFGGVKESGLGREGGVEGMLDYLETKYLCLGL
jgi:succinate-semialdehyde dehydrogenase / glutarate-semialdehyde dehydrogenase